MTVSHDEKADQAPAEGHSLPDPRTEYDTPKQVLDDQALSDPEKREKLEHWVGEVDRRLESESEGMGAGEPLHPRVEADLAHEATEASNALRSLDDDSGPTAS